jgi:hypothetical protein
LCVYFPLHRGPAKKNTADGYQNQQQQAHGENHIEGKRRT